MHLLLLSLYSHAKLYGLGQDLSVVYFRSQVSKEYEGGGLGGLRTKVCVDVQLLAAPMPEYADIELTVPNNRWLPNVPC